MPVDERTIEDLGQQALDAQAEADKAEATASVTNGEAADRAPETATAADDNEV